MEDKQKIRIYHRSETKEALKNRSEMKMKQIYSF